MKILTMKINIYLLVKAKTGTTVQLCFCNSLTKRCQGCIFLKDSLLKFPLSLRHYQFNYCYKFKNKFLELKYLLLSKIKEDAGKSCYLGTFLTKYFNFNQNNGTMGAAKTVAVL